MTVDEIEKAIDRLSPEEITELQHRLGWQRVRPKGVNSWGPICPESEIFFVELIQDAFYLSVQFHIPSFYRAAAALNLHHALHCGETENIFGNDPKIVTYHSLRKEDVDNYQVYSGRTVLKSGEQEAPILAFVCDSESKPFLENAEIMESFVRSHIVEKMSGTLLQLVFEAVYSGHSCVTANVRRQIEELPSLIGKCESLPLRKRGGSTSDYALDDIYSYYNSVLEETQRAKRIFKANKTSANWKEIMKLDVPDLPDDLVHRLSGNPADLPDEVKIILAEKGGTPSPSDIALEWSARLCGAPDYYYSLKTLKVRLTEQKKNSQNHLLKNSSIESDLKI